MQEIILQWIIRFELYTASLTLFHLLKNKSFQYNTCRMSNVPYLQRISVTSFDLIVYFGTLKVNFIDDGP